MAKQTAPIQEVSRALDLVPYLSTHSHISLKELATEFGVTEKEMSHELTNLSMCGLPGYTPYELIEVFFDSGFVSINNHDALDIPRALTNVEIASLLIGLELMRDTATEEHSGAVAQIDTLVIQLQKLIGNSIEVKDDPQTVFRSLIESAIASRKIVEISYTSPVRDEISLREVSPLSIYTEAPFTYLSAYCHVAEGFRNFRLDRVIDVRETAKDSLSKKAPSESSSEKIEVGLKVFRNRRNISELLQLEPISQDGQVKVDIYSPEWLIRAAIASSPDLLVEKPDSLKAQIASTAQNILALYRS